jgi:hypothetical protein
VGRASRADSRRACESSFFFERRSWLAIADLPLLLCRRVAAAGWEAERRLTDALFTRARILFTPGEACHASEPGFYRCCFAWMPTPAVVEGFNRLAAFAAGTVKG